MFMLGLGPIAVVHNQTGTSFSAREIASDYWCRPKIDRLLYSMCHLCMMYGEAKAYEILTCPHVATIWGVASILISMVYTCICKLHTCTTIIRINFIHKYFMVEIVVSKYFHSFDNCAHIILFAVHVHIDK